MSARPIAEELGVVVVDYRCRAGVHAPGPEEWNAAHNVAFVRRGVFALKTPRTSAVADPNQVLFFNAHQPYRVAHPVAGGDDCTSLVLPDALARQLVARHAPRDADDPNAPFRFDRALSSSRAIRLHYELLARARAGGALGLQDTLAELLDEALAGAYARRQEALDGRAAARRHDLAHAAAVAVQADLAATPSLADLARALGCSPFHLSRVFREVTGLSLRAYVKRLRARTAAEHLQAGRPTSRRSRCASATPTTATSRTRSGPNGACRRPPSAPGITDAPLSRKNVQARAPARSDLRGMSMLSDVLDAQAPAAYPDAMMLYGQFIGSWEGEATTYPPEGAAVRHSAEVHFGWVLEGQAVQDVWIVPARRDRRWPPCARNLYGTTLRVYDPAADAWNVTWINPPNGAFTRLVGRREGDRIVQHGEDRDGLNRWIFQEMTPDSFRWTGELSSDGGQTWRLAAEFALRRVAP